MKNAISKDNPYYLSKERYLELKHFCRQYPEWRKRVNSVNLTPSVRLEEKHDRGERNHPVEVVAELRCADLERLAMVEAAAHKASPDYWGYILEAVTEGRSYISLTMRDDLNCPRDKYYIQLRRFYWILDKLRK